MTGEQRNKATLEAFQRAWKAKDVEKLCALMTANGIYHSSLGPLPGQKWQGRDELHAGFQTMLAADGGEIIDRGVDYHHNIAFARWEYKPENGISQLGCDYFKFEDGLIALKDAYRKSTVPLPKISTPSNPSNSTPQKTGFTLREFEREDVEQLLQLMRDLAIFEGYIDDFAVTEKDLLQYGLEDNPSFKAFVCVATTGELAAMAVTYLIPWTYDLKPTIVMKELYVKPQWRSYGLGKQLLNAVYTYARQKGAARVQWTVLKTNDKAKHFYIRNGGKEDNTWELWGRTLL